MHDSDPTAAGPWRWRTPLTEDYGIDLPFVSAPMGLVALPELAAAVANAGGLGMLGAAPEPPERLAAMFERTRRLTSRPFGVGFVIEQLAFGPSTVDEHVEVTAEAGLPVAMFFWNPPPVAWIERLHAAGTRVWMQVDHPQAALHAADQGVDLIVAQGAEAGGHCRSQVGTFVALPAITDAVAPLPVLAAGGIADGRGVAAALALGAAGVLVGTRLVASSEAWAHDDYKRRLVAAGLDDAVRTSIFGPEWPDQPMRVLRNRAVERWRGRDERTPPPSDPPRTIGRSTLLGQEYELPEHSALLPTPDAEGDFEEMCMAAGQGAALVGGIKPAAEIVGEMMDDAGRILSRRLPGLLGSA